MQIRKFKLYYIVVIIISCLFFNVTYHQQLNREVNLLEDTYYYSNTEHKHGSINFRWVNNQQLEAFHKEVLALYDNKNVTVRTSYFDYEEDGKKIWNVFMYDPSNEFMSNVRDTMECTGDAPDLTNINENKVLSTDIDAKADGYIHLLDAKYLNRNHREIRISGLLNTYNHFHVVSNLTSYEFWYKDTMCEKELDAIASKYFDNSQYDIYANEEIHPSVNRFFNIYPVFVLYVLFLGLSLAYTLYEKYKQIAIETFVGYTSIEILKDCFRNELIGTILCLFAPMLILFAVYVSRINAYTLPLLCNLIFYGCIIVGLLIVVCIIFDLYLHNHTIYKTLVSKGNEKKLMFPAILVKVCYVVFISMFLTFTIAAHTDYYSLYKNYLSQKNVVDNLYVISSGDGTLAKEYDRILSDRGLIKCNFFINENFSESDPHYDVPFVIVNNAYMDIYDKPYHFDKTTFIVPEKYKEIDVSDYLYFTIESEEYDIEYVSHTNTFKSLSSSNYQEAKDPIVLVTNNYAYTRIHDMYLSNKHPISYYKNLVNEELGDNSIELTQNSTYVREVLNENIVPTIWNDFLLLCIYLGTFIFTIVFNINLYKKTNEKEIVLKTIFGYTHIQIYRLYYLITIIPYMFIYCILIYLHIYNASMYYILLLILMDYMITYGIAHTKNHKNEVLKEV